MFRKVIFIWLSLVSTKKTIKHNRGTVSCQDWIGGLSTCPSWRWDWRSAPTRRSRTRPPSTQVGQSDIMEISCRGRDSPPTDEPRSRRCESPSRCPRPGGGRSSWRHSSCRPPTRSRPASARTWSRWRPRGPAGPWAESRAADRRCDRWPAGASCRTAGGSTAGGLKA